MLTGFRECVLQLARGRSSYVARAAGGSAVVCRDSQSVSYFTVPPRALSQGGTSRIFSRCAARVERPERGRTGPPGPAEGHAEGQGAEP